MALAFRNFPLCHSREGDLLCLALEIHRVGEAGDGFYLLRNKEELADNWSTSVVKALLSLAGDRWPSTIMKERVPPESKTLWLHVWGAESPQLEGSPGGPLGKALSHEPAKGGVSAPDVLDT